MNVIASEVSEEEPKILLSPEKEERFKELKKFIGYLKKVKCQIISPFSMINKTLLTLKYLNLEKKHERS